jgi:hypothetical protein
MTATEVATTTYQVGNIITRCHTTRRVFRNANVVGFQQLTLDQMNSVIREIDLFLELLREELRLIENTKASDQGAYDGVNHG